jgi:hypothetical protein
MERSKAGCAENLLLEGKALLQKADSSPPTGSGVQNDIDCAWKTGLY